MSGLKIEDIYTQLNNDDLDTLDFLMSLQKTIQEDVYGYNFKAMRENMRTLEQFSTMNYHAIQDELREFFEALGGMSEGGNAIWKPWKSKFKEYEGKEFHSLSREDKLEIWYELVDVQHFIFNLMLAVGMTPSILVNLYAAKNKENIDRQKRGY